MTVFLWVGGQIVHTEYILTLYCEAGQETTDRRSDLMNYSIRPIGTTPATPVTGLVRVGMYAHGSEWMVVSWFGQ